METLVVIAHHRNQGYSRCKSQISDRFGSSPSRAFNGINCRCRAFQSGNGILPSPPRVFPSLASSPEPINPDIRSAPAKLSRRSSPITISPEPSRKVSAFSEEFSCSELWAGPTYSNSPPPSSLPIPKFSLLPKRSISFELHDLSSSFTLQPEAKSAPTSPTCDSRSSSPDFFLSTSFATENLRRILNLDHGS
ncbi:hypothetical protein AXF42_Ash010488 [Apostasia shenzhenica]|uniref:Uncharacterized protein n=1 Tax=Apostasia shenzhenica TaxID=1088818 RepID=A0A2I0BE69_9ASPA|nr:hypothetical protein AXF42_Ash010488 [Apostasia shenzhenica]